MKIKKDSRVGEKLDREDFFIGFFAVFIIAFFVFAAIFMIVLSGFTDREKVDNLFSNLGLGSVGNVVMNGERGRDGESASETFIVRDLKSWMGMLMAVVVVISLVVVFLLWRKKDSIRIISRRSKRG